VPTADHTVVAAHNDTLDHSMRSIERPRVENGQDLTEQTRKTVAWEGEEAATCHRHGTISTLVGVGSDGWA